MLRHLSQVIDQLRGTFGDLDVAIMDENGELKDGEAIMEEYGDKLPITQQEKLQALVDIFGTRAMPTMLSIVNAGTEDFNNLRDALYNTQGAAQEMADTRLDNLGGDITLLKDQLLDLAISLGDIMVPVLRDDIIPAISGVVEWFSSLDDGTKEMIIKAGLLTAAVGPVLSVGGRLITGVGTLVSGVGGILKVVGGLAGTGTTIVSGIGSVVGAIGSGATGLVGAIGGVISSIGAAVIAAGPVLLVIAGVAAAVAGLAYVVYKNWDDIKDWTSNLVTNVSNKWDEFKENTKNAWEATKKAISTIWGEIEKNTKETVDEMKRKVHDAWTNIRTTTETIWNSVKTTISNVAKNMKDTIADAAKKMWDSISGTLSSLAENAWNWGSNMINKLGEGINNAWSWVESSVSGMKNFFANTLGNLAGDAWNWGKDMVSNLKSGIESKINTVKTAASNVASAISSKLHFSVPDSGPLADADTYMPDMMKLYAEGIYKNIGLIDKAADSIAAALVPTYDTGAINSARSTSITNGDTVINVYGAAGQDVRELADIVVHKLTVQANRSALSYG